MVTAVKKIYEEALLADHPGAAPSGTFHSSYATIEAHKEESIHGLHYSVLCPLQSIEARMIYRFTPKGNVFLDHVLQPRDCGLDLQARSCGFCRVSNKAALEHRFAELVTEWRKETGGLSSPRAITGHHAYKQIVAMGVPVLPLIFEELQKNGGWWYPALRALTGENPVPKEAKGKPPLSRKAWLEWGRRNDYLRQ